MKQKFYQTDMFRYGMGIAVGMLLYKIIHKVFFD